MNAALRAVLRRSPLLHCNAAHGSSLLRPSACGAALSASLNARWLATESTSKLVKRKVALVAGYLGTGYHGVQLNKNVPTIENELRQAILEAGAMRESNFVDLSKIDWSRSSRTDKGVHAGCIVFSGKLLIDEEKNVDPATGRIRGLTDAINAALPPTIRLFSCTRVNKRFSARKNCVLREYEYFMPLSFLKTSCLAATGMSEEEWHEQDAVDEFCRALRDYEGIHDFHNFTKSRSFFYRQHARTAAEKASGRAVETSDDHEVEADDEDDSNDLPSEDYTSLEYGEFENSSAVSRKPLPRHRRAIYSCSGSLINDFGGEPYLRVHIVGQAFLLHQIRCMVGGALAVATKAMTRTQFNAAINTNRIVRIPIAPAEGLVLLSSTFGGKLHSVSLYEDQNTHRATDNREVTHRVLLNAEEDLEMQRFRENIIYEEVISAWSVSDTDQWRNYLRRSLEANEAINDEELQAMLKEAEEQKSQKKERQRTFVQNNRTAAIEERKPRGVLPRQFTTKLCVRYSIAPGIFTTDVRRGIAKHLRLGKLRIDASEEELFDYIDRYGIEAIAQEGRDFMHKKTSDECDVQK